MHYQLTFLYGFLLALVVTSHIPMSYPYWTNSIMIGGLVLLGALLVGYGILSVSLSKIIGWTLGIFWGVLHGAPPVGIQQVGQTFQVVARNSLQFQSAPILGTPSNPLLPESRPKSPRLQLYGPLPLGATGVLAYREKPNHQPLWSTAGGKQFYLIKINQDDADKRKTLPPSIVRKITLQSEDLKDYLKTLCEKTLTRQKHMIWSWLVGIYLGDQSEIPETVKEAFKRVGLYHLLSVGGLHITVLTTLGTFLLRAPLMVLYGSGVVLKPHCWGWFLQIFNLVCIVFALLYLVMSGATPAVQRAVFIYVLYLSGLLFGGKQSLTHAMICGLFLQALVFPIGFLSEASVMSWVCYLRVCQLLQQPSGIWRKLLETLKLQGELAVMGGAFFGQFSLIGLFVNGPLIGVFTALFVISIVLFLPGISFLDGFGVQLHRSFLDVVLGLADLTSGFSLSYLELNDMDWKVRGLFILLTAYFVLSNFKKRTIEPIGRNAYVQSVVERRIWRDRLH